MPAYYKSTFKLDKVGDTFLDMSTWGKGMVWVNGHAMGRFWEIGPQQTLFMPGCWLKEGENEILVLDLKGPAKASIKGLKKPILDLLRRKDVISVWKRFLRKQMITSQQWQSSMSWELMANRYLVSIGRFVMPIVKKHAAATVQPIKYSICRNLLSG